MDDAVVARLLEGDVAVRFRTGRDLLGRADQGLQARIGCSPRLPRTYPRRGDRSADPDRWVTLVARKVLAAYPASA